MTTALLGLLGLLMLHPAPEYDRYQLFELVLVADVVVAGEIESVGSATFQLRIENSIVGEGLPASASVQRFEDWTCASRWQEYAAGQRVLLFLEKGAAGPYRILGAGGEGEMPLLASDVIVRGYRVRGHDEERSRLDGVEVEGARVSLDEFQAAVRGFRSAAEFEKGSSRRGEALRTLAPHEAETWKTFAASSRTARHLCDEARSAKVWRGPVAAESTPLPFERLPRISAKELGCTGRVRLAGRAPDEFDFDQWSGFGSALAFLGDVDGDGIGDLAVGAASDSRASHSAGTAWILFLERDGTVKSRVEIGEGTGGFPAKLNEFAQLGEALAPLGDLDRDGVPDVVVGAGGWKRDDGGRGGAWILFLKRDGTVRSAVELSANAALRRQSVGDGNGLGAALACLGDLDGDGRPELALGQEPEFDVESEHGRAVCIASLSDDGGVRWVRRYHDREDGFARGYSWFGEELSRIGDVDGNGTCDLAIANTYDDDGGRVFGAVWIVFLEPDGSSRARQKISAWAGGFEGQLRDHESFGEGLAGPGDLDGDHIPDLLVGSGSGLWTLLLRTDGTVRGHRLLARPPGSPKGGLSFGGTFACASSPASGPFLALSGTLGKILPRSADDRYAEMDAVVWFLGRESDGVLGPWAPR